MQQQTPLPDQRYVPCPVCLDARSETSFEVRGYRIARCGGCGFLFVNPRPTEAGLLALYAARGGNPFMNPRFEPFEDELPVLRIVVSRLQRHTPSGHLLELGCGRGDLLRVAAEAGYEAEGCDLFGGNVPACPGARLHDGFLRDLALPGASFDVVVTRNTLEHLENPEIELREIARILRPGGLLYVKVPNERYEHGWRSRMAFQQKHIFDPPWHLNHFSPPRLAQLLRRVGFVPVAWETERPTAERSPLKNAVRLGGYGLSRIMHVLSGGRFFPQPAVVCLARRGAKMDLPQPATAQIPVRPASR